MDSTREQILATGIAPVGKRSCDVPLTPEQQKWLEYWVTRRRRIHIAASEFIPGYEQSRHRFMRWALEVCKLTGLTPREYDALTDDEEISVVESAAEMAAATVAARRSELVTPPADAGKDASTPPVDLATIVKRLEAYAKQYAYASHRKLAQSMDCSQSTIRNAFKASATLKAWQAKAKPLAKDTNVRTGQITDDTARNTVAPTTPGADDLHTESLDNFKSRLIQHARQSERAELNAKSDAEWLEIYVLARQQAADR